MARTPEVDDWLKQTMTLIEAGIGVAGTAEPDEDTLQMLREVQAAATGLLAALAQIRLVVPGTLRG